MLAPGGAEGTTLTIAGDLAMRAGSDYLVHVGLGAASSAQVNGVATLGGEVLIAGAATPLRLYTILDATGGFAGTKFAGVASANFVGALSYGANDVMLTLAAQLGSGTLVGNSARVAASLDAIYNATGALPPNFLALYSLSGPALSGAVAAATGEAATAQAQTSFQSMNTFLNTVLDASAGGRFAPGAGDGPAATQHGWTTWASVMDSYAKTAGDPLGAGSHDVSSSAGGLAAGADYRLSANAVVGFALGGGSANWSLAQGLGGGRDDFFQAGAYGSTRWGAYLSGALAFADGSVTTTRNGPLGAALAGDFSAQTYAARVEGGYRFATPVGGISPYAALQPQRSATPAYREADASGSGFGLSYAAGGVTDMRSELGARFDAAFALDAARSVSLRGRLAWSHDWAGAPSIAAQFETLPSVGFTTVGAAPARDAALLSGGAELRLAKGVTFGLTADADLAGPSKVYGGNAVLKMSW